MEELLQLKAKLSEERPAPWDNLPDIELYKDQVLNYMKRQNILQSEDAQLTGAMINNYIKSGLLPRTNEKKYTKDHLAYLTAIYSLKQVLSVKETDLLLKQQPHIMNVEKFYLEYQQLIDAALTETADSLDVGIAKEDLATCALRLALSSFAQKLACEKILDILNEKKPTGKSKK